MKKLLLVIGSAVLLAGCHTDKNSGGTGSQSDTNFNFRTNEIAPSGGIGNADSGKSSGRSDSDTSNNKVSPNKDSGNTPDSKPGTPQNSPSTPR